MMTRIALILALLLMPVVANAQFLNGERFVEDWQAWQKGQRQGVELLTRIERRDYNAFESYIIGVADGLVAVQAIREQDLAFCIPNGTSSFQLFQAISNHIEDNPTIWNMKATLIVWLALQETWPCNN